MQAPAFENRWAKFYLGHCLDVLKQMPDESVQTVVTSPPYFGMRDYGIEPCVWGGNSDCEHDWSRPVRTSHKNRNRIGLHSEREESKLEGSRVEVFDHGYGCFKCGAWVGVLGAEYCVDQYVEHICMVMDEVFRVLKSDGTLWLNIGDSYARHAGYDASKSGWVEGKDPVKGTREPPFIDCKTRARRKQLLLTPQRVAIALSDQYLLRSEITWCKSSPLPSQFADRPTTATEKLYLFAKQGKYKYDSKRAQQLTANGNRINLYDYWVIGPDPSKTKHTAAFPRQIPRRCIKLTSEPGDVVLDPFMGSGRTAEIATDLNRKFIGIDLNESYLLDARELV